jgi:Ca2+-binding EF-hand superfamily protein
MLRAVPLIGALIFAPTVASAQQPCTSDARQVVNEVYRQVLERGMDSGGEHWVEQLADGTATVRDVVREVARSPEHMQRFGAEPPERSVATLYRHLLGRQADDTGLRGYVQLASERGLESVVDRLMSSQEYQSTFGANGVPGSSIRYCGARGTSGFPDSRTNRDMRFRGMDRNRDGRIARSEWRGNARSFDRHDWNNDGVLAGNEVRPGAQPPDAFMDDYGEVDNERFDYLDYNGNARIDSHEWDGTPAAFDRLDRNNDGTLTRAELNATSGTRFNDLDSNADGRITLAEWRWSRTAFDRQDRDNDGVLSRREYREGAVGTSGR